MVARESAAPSGVGEKGEEREVGPARAKETHNGERGKCIASVVKEEGFEW